MTLHAWEYLHNITHINHEFQTVDNTFICPSDINDIWQWNTTSYQQSIQMFAILPIGLGFIYFFISLLMVGICCCCKCCKTSNNQQQERQRQRERERQRQQHVMQARLLDDNNIHRLDSVDDNDGNQIPPPLPINNGDIENEEEEDVMINRNGVKLTFCASFLRYLLSFLSICLIIFCVFIGCKLDSTITDVQTNWDNSYEPYDICINYGHSIENILLSAKSQCEIIQKKHTFPIPQCVAAVNISNQIEIYIEESLNEIDNYLNDGQVISWGNSSDFDIYRKYSIYIGISILSLIALIIIISTFCIKSLNTIKKCICCNSFLSILLICGMLLIWIISSYQFAFSIQVSDACDNPQNSILQGVNVTNNKNIDDTTIDIIKYYIYCDNNHNYNPLQNYTETAYNSLITINETIYEMRPYGFLCNISNETEILFNDYNETLHELINVEQSLQCDDINEYLTNITEDLCVDGINYWYLLYSSQIFVIILLIIRSYCICSKSEIDYDFSDNNHFNVVVSNNNNNNNNNNNYQQLAQKQIVINKDNNNNNNDNEICQDIKQREEGRGSPFINPITPRSPSPPKYNKKQPKKPMADPNFTDNDVRKCLKYLLSFSDCDNNEIEKIGQELIKNGYNNNGIPLHDNLVKKAVAILKNYRFNQDSKFTHPLLKGLV